MTDTAKSQGLSNTEQLVHLHAQLPLPVILAMPDCHFTILFQRRPVHWLKIKMRKIQMLKYLWIHPGLWIDQFEFVPGCHDDFRVRFRTDTDPVDSSRYWNRAISLDSDFQSLFMKCVD